MQLQTIEYTLNEKPNSKTKRVNLKNFKVRAFANSDNQLFLN